MVSDINRLPDTWRKLADCLTGNEADLLRNCANALEEAWHEHAHNAAWYPEECAICREEMKENE